MHKSDTYIHIIIDRSCIFNEAIVDNEKMIMHQLVSGNAHAFFEITDNILQGFIIIDSRVTRAKNVLQTKYLKLSQAINAKGSYLYFKS